MSREKWFDAISPQPFIADGTAQGLVSITNAVYFKVKQTVIIQATGQPDLRVIVKRVISPTLLIVGPPGTNIDTFSNISAYTVASSATIHADAQTRIAIPDKEFFRAGFDEEPANRFRVGSFDQLGNPINTGNPFPVNLYPPAQIPFSLMMLAFPAILNTELAGLTYDQVVSTSVDGEEVLSFYLGGTLLTSITLTQTASGWNLGLGSPGVDFLLLENGAPFELENGTGGILLEH